MQLLGKNVLIKLKMRNKGNVLLVNAVDKLIKTIEDKHWICKEDVKIDRPDADQVHADGFFFFNIHIHRTLIMMELGEDGEATIIWAGTHQEYEKIFKNSKTVIGRWLANKGWI